ncbi:immunoglobulin-like domain-containing protein [Actinomyces sp. B33]|uniref:immunoglobulin-like domain-containing protein n=1 Tax=Actinomyces sp. B33 TaxID=2942131 RepID=UPI002342491B|nr:immunoglobulin-like domain-containing protein [Actinomyces sp. B33]
MRRHHTPLRTGIVAAALAGLVGTGLIAVPAAPATAATTDPIAEYLFTSAPADSTTIKNTAPDATVGDARVRNGAARHWTDSSLLLTGGSKTGSGTWVELPDDLLKGSEQATVQMEVKADAPMLNAFHFLWNIGNDSSDTEYFFSSLNCGNGRRPLVGIKASGREELVQAGSCGVSADQWISVTSVVEDSTASLYIDGVRVASGPVSATPAKIADQSLNAIGRSPWPDPLFSGAVSSFRVWNRGLSADEIADLSARDATLHETAITARAQAILDGLTMPSGSIDADFVTLPTASGAVAWTSSAPEVIAPTGAVVRPSLGAEPVQVDLTATATVRGLSATRTVRVTVEPSTLTDAERLDQTAQAYAIQPVLQSGTTLPAGPAGTTLTLAGDASIGVDEARTVTVAGDQPVEGTITATIAKDGATVVKAFPVTVLPRSASTQILSYHRTATTEDRANNGDIAYSMHLALDENGTWTPLNENYGVFFARTATSPAQNEDINTSLHRSLKDPSLFTAADGTYGVVAVRTARGTAQADATGATSILVASSKDLLSYEEAADSGSIIDVGETNGVNAPYVVWDSSQKHYLVGWTDDGGIDKHTTFDSLADSTATHGPVRVGAVSVSGSVDDPGIEDYAAGRSIAIPASVADALKVRLGRVVNTGASTIAGVSVDVDTPVAELPLASTIDLSYSDGSTATLPVSWDLSLVDTSKPGSYQATGTVLRDEYPVPFAEERADPSVYKWQWKREDGAQTKYLMIATNDIRGDNVWQNGTPHMPIRMADSITALADTPGDSTGLIDSRGYNPKESVLMSKGQRNSQGQAITGSFWAPEFHEIDGKLTILFMPSYNSRWTDGAAAYTQLKKDDKGFDLDPTVAANWTVPTTVTRADGKPLATTASGGVGMSLDMTYFTDQAGQSYYAWQQLGAIYIATMDPADPSKVTSIPRRIVAPEYAWDNAIAEGPNVVERDGKLYLIYSGSAVGKSYTTGLAVADASGASDLTDPASWAKLNYPIQKSGIFNGQWQLGTGHGMWTEDEHGSMLYVFHAYANNTPGYSNYSGRDMFVRRVHWASDSMPIFDMDLDEEVAPRFATVTATVTVGGGGVDVPAPSAHYDMTRSAGKLVDVSGNGHDAALTGMDDASFIDIDGQSIADFTGTGYATLPSGPITRGDNDFTVEITVAGAALQNQFGWVIGDGIGDWNTTRLGNYVFVNPASSERAGGILAGIRVKKGSSNGEVRMPAGGAMSSTSFTTVTMTSKDNNLSLYVDGKKVSTVDHEYSLSDIVPTGDVLGYIGRSLYRPDGLLKAKVSDVKLWDKALTPAEVASSAPGAAERTKLFQAILDRDILAAMLGGNASAEEITQDLTLPASVNGMALTWQSSAPQTISATGVVSRTSQDVPVTMTATDTTGTPHSFALVVKAISENEVAAQVAADLDAIGLDEVAYENLPLVASGTKYASAITWTSSDPALVTETDPGYTAAPVGATDPYAGAGIVTRPAYGAGNAAVTLTATAVKGEARESRTFNVTIAELGRSAPDAGYAAAYFTSDSDEKVYEAYTTENNFFTFTPANGSKPVLAPTTDTTGLRDPYILRSVNGDKYYMVATDLCIGCGTSWGDAQSKGSLKIEVWESTDLVTWTRTNENEDTGITVNRPEAGMTWAPEVAWDEHLQAYVVFFASRLYDDVQHTSTSTGGHARMFYVITRDFEHFTYPPQTWQDTGRARIDSTVTKIGDYYYRFTKNEDSGAADGLERGKDIFLERSTVLTAPTASSNWDADPTTTWQLVDTAMTTKITGQAGEGPQIVKLNEGDPNNAGDTYAFLVDNYGNGGYVPFLAEGSSIAASAKGSRLSERADWKAHSTSGLPASPRHGAFVNVPQTVLDAMDSWTGIAPVASTTKVTVADSVATAVVTAADRGDVIGTVTFSSGQWSRTIDLTDHRANVEVPDTVTGVITASYDGFRDGLVKTSTGTVNADGTPTGDGTDDEPIDTQVPAADVHYAFDEAPADGRTIDNVAGDGLDAALEGTGGVFANGALALPGGAAGSDAAHVTIPGRAFDGRDVVTINIWMANATGNGNYAGAYVGNASQNNGYWLFNPSNPNGRVKSVITTATPSSPSTSPWSTERGTAERASTSSMAMYTTVIDGKNGVMSVYLNGHKISDTAITTDLTSFGDLVAFIGKSPYPDAFFKGTVDDYSLHYSALSPRQITALYRSQALERAKAQVAAAIPATATEDFALPTTAAGVTVRWAVADGDAIGIDGARARVSRPAAEAGDATVRLVATYVMDGTKVSTSEREVLVPADLSDQDKAQADLDAVSIVNAEDMRTNFSVPTQGAHGSTIAWSVVDDGGAQADIGEGVNSASRTVTVRRPAAGNDPVTLTLKAVSTNGGGSATKQFTVVVQPMPSDEDATEAYVWAFFTGEGDGAEKISIAASKGNDALAWNTLNNGVPVIESTAGTGGLRDPFILRSHEGDKFYMIATDLKVAGLAGGFTTAQREGSRYIEIWESTDLVNWSQQRHVKVSSDLAGNTWAPEAFYDEASGTYVVYWASNLYDSPDASARTSLTYNRMVYVTTDDFVSFSEPTVWIDSQRGNGRDGKGAIDVTVGYEDGVYYRVYKDERDMSLREEKSTNLFAELHGEFADAQGPADEWTLIGAKLLDGLDNACASCGGKFTAGEGPTLFPANEGDVNGAKWFLFADQPNYHGGPNHYIGFATDRSLAETGADGWYSVAQKLSANMPQNADGGKPRHGTVIPVTRDVYQKVLEELQPDIAVASVAAMEVSTTVGTVPVLPASAELTMADGSSSTAEVVWEEVAAESYATPGTFTVRGVAQNDSREPVEVVVTVSPVPSSDASLASLTIAGVTVDLTRDPLAVEVADPRALTADGVVAVASDEGARAEVVVEGTTVTVTVTAEDGTTARYSVSVGRAPEPTHDPAVVLDDDEVVRGQILAITGTGFVPGASVEAVFHSTPVAIGVEEADGDGGVGFTFTVPADAEFGEHRVVLTQPSTGLEAEAALAVFRGENPDEPVDPDQPVDPVDPDQPVDPVDPDKPVDPVDPDKPVNPVDPDKPVDPVDPDQPVDPVDPDQPVDPVDPDKPVDPVDPDKPVNPVDPDKPVDPAQPDTPVAPDDSKGGDGVKLKPSVGKKPAATPGRALAVSGSNALVVSAGALSLLGIGIGAVRRSRKTR